MTGPPADRARRHRFLTRWVGVTLVLAGLAAAALVLLAPIPTFEELEPRTGTVVEARRERFRPCRRGDCTRTIVTVRHDAGTRDYHFADADTALFQVGAPITLRVHPELRGTDRLRVWHAEQGGRVLREHASQARVERPIRWGALALCPLLIAGGGWIARNYTWSGRPVA